MRAQHTLARRVRHTLRLFVSRATRVLVHRSVLRLAGIADGVGLLRHNPLGMFFYNLRALVLVGGALFLLFVAPLVSWQAPEAACWLILATALAIDVAITVARHRQFRAQLQTWASSAADHELPRIFDFYFQLDIVIIAFTVGASHVLGLPLELLSLLAVSEAVLYAAYSSGRFRPHGIFALTLPVVIVLLTPWLIFSRPRQPLNEMTWAQALLNLAPLLSLTCVTFGCVAAVSRLQANGVRLSRFRIELLGRYQRAVLAGIHDSRLPDYPSKATSYFQLRIETLLRRLCRFRRMSWYHAAWVLLLERHNVKGDVWLPRASVRCSIPSRCIDTGIDAASVRIPLGQVTVIPRYRHEDAAGTAPLSPDRVVLPPELWPAGAGGPTAFLPLVRGDRVLGVVGIFGKDDSPPVRDDEVAFFSSICALAVAAIQEWGERSYARSQQAISRLVTQSTLDELLSSAVSTAQSLLRAQAAMIWYDGGVPASHRLILRNDAGETVTRSRAAPLPTIRSTLRLDEFTDDSLRGDCLRGHLDALHCKPVAILAVPIIAGAVKGGILLVNRTTRSTWFTDRDTRVCEGLCRRLGALIERFERTAETEKALALAATQAEEAKQAKERAEAATARTEAQAQEAKRAKGEAEKALAQREQDLMTLTHQLYGPLTSAKMAVTSLPYLGREARERALEHAAALIEDVMDVSYATFNALALDAKRDAARDTAGPRDQQHPFRAVAINALSELKLLAARLEQTNPRGNLEFAFVEDDDFPPLIIDRRVFASVMYSLVDNARKYASPGTTIRLECTFERATGEPALKVKSRGVPIQMHEREHIFRKFGRGFLVSTTGRHHHGIGVGLWAARELMRAIGGNVTVELSSETPDLSVFIVHCPGARR